MNRTQERYAEEPVANDADKKEIQRRIAKRKVPQGYGKIDEEFDADMKKNINLYWTCSENIKRVPGSESSIF